jgi:hypothetical protein
MNDGSRKKGAVWQVDSLLGNYHEVYNSKQQPLLTNGPTNKYVSLATIALEQKKRAVAVHAMMMF